MKIITASIVAWLLFIGGMWAGAAVERKQNTVERPAGAVSPIGGQAEMPTAIREALRLSCDPILVASAIRAADVFRRSTMTEGLSVALRMQWAQLAAAEELFVVRCMEAY